MEVSQRYRVFCHAYSSGYQVLTQGWSWDMLVFFSLQRRYVKKHNAEWLMLHYQREGVK